MKEEIKANYNLLKIAEKFKVAHTKYANNTCGNIVYDIDKSCEFSNKVSSPLMLARLCALFNGLQIDVTGQANYKTTFWTLVKHKTSGKYITFYDWKGRASVGSSNYDKKNLKDKLFLKDCKNLLKALTDERCPHPYDSVTIGHML